MHLELTADQQLIQDSVRRFVEAEVKPHAAKWDASGEFPWAAVRGLAELGMMGEMLKRRLPKHLDRAECAACHAQWSPQCTGRVLGQDMARSAPDWLEDGDVADPSQAARQANLKRTAHPWEETVSPYIWAASPVAVNPRGKLAPQVPGCRVTYAPLNASPLLRREIQDPLRVTFQPHSISRQHQRHCVDCHCRTVTGAR